MYALFEKIVTAFSNQPWILAFLIVAIGVGYLITLMIKNTTLTAAFASRISDVDTADIVKEIRATQIESNLDRKKQGDAIESIDSRLTLVERDLRELKSRNQT